MAHKRRFKGFVYEDPKPAPPPGEWVHKGGGYYEHTVTGETRRGKP